MKYQKILLIFFVFTTFLGIILYKFFPQARVYVFNEDYLIENLTAIFFLISFAIGCFAIISFNKIIHGKTLIIVTILALFGFLDELGFGERIFDLTMPKYKSIQIDGIHDIFSLFFVYVDKNVFLFNTIFLTTLMLIFLSGIILLRKNRIGIQNIKLFFKSNPHFTFIVFSGILIFLSQIFDLRMINWKKGLWMVLEEVFEMNGALALIFANLSIYNYRHSNQKNTFTQANLEKKPAFQKTNLISIS